MVRASESTNKQILDSSKQLDRTKQRLEAEISALKESLQVLEIDHSVGLHPLLSDIRRGAVHASMLLFAEM